MPRLARSLANKFIVRTEDLEKTRAKMEALFNAGQVGLNDIEQVYSGLYLDIFTEFEITIENLFLGLLSGSLYSRKNLIERKAKIQPVSMTRAIVFGDRAYLDWLPYRDKTIERAEVYFVDGKPFTLLTSTQKSNLDEYGIIRNALAHKSDSAKKRFQKLINGLSLLPREKSPTGFLRSRPYSASTQTQYEITVWELIDMIKNLCG